jgi:hypothetical protein
LLDELEPAWREAYSDPLNLVRVLQAKAQEATDVFHERQQREAVEREVARFRTIHECECDSAVGHDEYCVNNLFDRMEAAEAERETAIEAGLNADGRAFTLQQLAAKLLVLAEEQRRAHHNSDDVTHFCEVEDCTDPLCAAATALLTEAKELGIDATTPAMAPEPGDAPR